MSVPALVASWTVVAALPTTKVSLPVPPIKVVATPPSDNVSPALFAPIVAPSQVPWGRKALPRYLGADSAAWADYDACELVRRQTFPGTILIDQGDADPFLEAQLKPELCDQACAEAGQTLLLRRHAGYDHSYWFIASFVEDHLRHHAGALLP